MERGRHGERSGQLLLSGVGLGQRILLMMTEMSSPFHLFDQPAVCGLPALLC